MFLCEGYRADTLIVAPPRTGLDDKLLDTILTYVPEKMVYVSCNVSILARDLVKLVKVYDLHYIQSVDMFPHTARTEAVQKETGIKGKNLFMPIRIAVSGEMHGPELPDTIYLLGREKSIQHIDNMLKQISN